MKWMSSQIHVLMMVALLSGCSNPMLTRDVSKNQRYHIGYIPGQMYKLIRGAELSPCSTSHSTQWTMVDPTDTLLTVKAPKGCEYLCAPGSRENVTAQVPPGSRIKITSLKSYTFQTLSDKHRIVAAFGELLDTEKAGTPVSLLFVSTLNEDIASGVEYQCPDPQDLEQVGSEER